MTFVMTLILAVVGAVIASVVWFRSKGKSLERPETLPLPADNSARSRAGTGAEAEIEEATLGLDKRMTLRWLRAALIPSFDEEEPIEQVTVL